MDEYAVAVGESITTVFSTMLALDVFVGEPQHMKEQKAATHDVSGIISFSGDLVGTMALCFSSEMAIKIVKSFTGMDVKPGDDDFADAIGELANMAAGSAKSRFERNISLSCPSVVIGSGHQIHPRRDFTEFTVPCECAGGSFDIEVSIKDNAAQGQAEKAA